MLQVIYIDRSLHVFKDTSIITLSPWDEGFTCSMDIGDKSIPFAPTSQLLEADGTAHIGILDEGMGNDKIARGGKALLAYLNTIPLIYRSMAAPFPASCQWLALEAMNKNADFMNFVAQERNGAGVGYIASVWLFLDAHTKSVKEREDTANAMMKLKRTLMLQAITNNTFNKSYFKLLNRLPLNHVTADKLEVVRRCALNKEVMQAFAGIPRLDSFEILDLVWEMPSWLRKPWLVHYYNHEFIPPFDRDQMLPNCVISATAEFRNGILQSLKKFTQCEWNFEEEYLELIDRWVCVFEGEKKLPEPPIPGNGNLVPITTPRELAKEAREMKNCVTNYLKGIRSGWTYLYSWRGRERATVQLSLNEQSDDWFLNEHLGIANQRLQDDTINQIQSIVRKQLPRKPRRNRTFIAGLPYYQAGQVRGRLCVGAPLLLRREPGNQYDHRAIEVLTDEGVKLGYIPRQRNKKFARLMDEGETLTARVAPPNEDRPYDIYAEILIPAQVDAIEQAA